MNVDLFQTMMRKARELAELLSSAECARAERLEKARDAAVNAISLRSFCTDEQPSATPREMAAIIAWNEYKKSTNGRGGGMTDFLSSPCKFCGYNGEGYFQKGTHDIHCPWFSIGGRKEREEEIASSSAPLPESLSERVEALRAKAAKAISSESELDWRRRSMKAVADFLKPNWSNDMDWVDEIIIAIEQRGERDLVWPEGETMVPIIVLFHLVEAANSYRVTGDQADAIDQAETILSLLGYKNYGMR